MPGAAPVARLSPSATLLVGDWASSGRLWERATLTEGEGASTRHGLGTRCGLGRTGTGFWTLSGGGAGS